MKKHVMMAMLLAGACLVVGCSQGSKETEKQTEAKVQTEAAATEAKTEEAVTEAVTEIVGAELIETEAEETEAVTEQATEAAQTEEMDDGDESVAESVIFEEEEDSEEASEQMSEEAEQSTLEQLGERPSYKALDHVELGTYKGLEVTTTPIEVTEDQIDNAISSNIAQQDLYDEVTEGKVADGDIANIDYVGKKDGKAFDGGSAEGYDLTIGSGTFIDGFEEGLIGAEVGKTIDLNLTFPEEYGNADLAGQDVVFTVTVNSIKRIPEMTDELATKLMGSDATVESYRAQVKDDLTKQAEQAEETYINNELMTQLYNVCEVKDYPQDLVDYSVKEMKLYYENYANAYGMTFEDFISNYFGMDEKSYNEQAEDAVKQSIQQELILVAIAENEKLEVTDEEFAAGCEKYAENMGYDSVDEFKENYDESKIRVSLLMDEAMDLVRENANIVEEEETEDLSELVGDVLEVVEEDTEAVTEKVTE